MSARKICIARVLLILNSLGCCTVMYEDNVFPWLLAGDGIPGAGEMDYPGEIWMFNG